MGNSMSQERMSNLHSRGLQYSFVSCCSLVKRCCHRRFARATDNSQTVLHFIANSTFTPGLPFQPPCGSSRPAPSSGASSSHRGPASVDPTPAEAEARRRHAADAAYRRREKAGEKASSLALLVLSRRRDAAPATLPDLDIAAPHAAGAEEQPAVVSWSLPGLDDVEAEAKTEDAPPAVLEAAPPAVAAPAAAEEAPDAATSPAVATPEAKSEEVDFSATAAEAADTEDVSEVEVVAGLSAAWQPQPFGAAPSAFGQGAEAEAGSPAPHQTLEAAADAVDGARCLWTV